MADERVRRFERLYDDNYAQVMAFARRRVHIEAAEEVVAATFVAAWHNLDRLGANPLPWLYRVALRAIAHDRRGDARRSRLVERLGTTPWTDVRDRVDDAGIAETVLAALSHLSARDREILQLAYWEELAVRELPLVLGCSPTAAKVRLHRARVRLRRLLETEAPFAPALDAVVAGADACEQVRVVRGPDWVGPKEHE